MTITTTPMSLNFRIASWFAPHISGSRLAQSSPQSSIIFFPIGRCKTTSVESTQSERNASLTCWPSPTTLPEAFLAAESAPERPNCVGTPSMRCVELIFLTMVIWKQVAEPWREVIVE